MKITLHMLELGWVVSKPVVEGSRYDLIVDDGHGLKRVQCKTGRYRNGCVRFNTCSVATWKPVKIGYAGDVDAFAVHCTDTGKFYFVPVGQVAKIEALLRVEPTKNGQSKGIVRATQFEF